MGDELRRPLTKREQSVADLIGQGYSQRRVSRLLKLDEKYVANLVGKIADLLPNSDDLSPQAVVMLWAAHRRWLHERHPADGAA